MVSQSLTQNAIMNPRPFLNSLVIFICLAPESVGVCSKQLGDTLQRGVELTCNDSLVSAGGNFRLSIFDTQNHTRYYVGIFFNSASKDRAVWVANRESPFSRSSVYLTIDSSGNLAMKDGKMQYVITNTSTSPTYATLLDSGNLVVIDLNSVVLWQSFNEPTDTILPGMTIENGNSLTLQSWKNAEDPAPGSFTLNVSISQLVVMRGSEVYGKYDSSIFNFGEPFNRTDDKFPLNRTGANGSNGNYTFNYLLPINRTYSRVVFNLTHGNGNGKKGFPVQAENRIVLEVSGEVNQQFWSNQEKRWISVQSSICWTHLCGNFSICNPQNRPPCNCLQGFDPYDENSWRRGNTSLGCVRRKPLTCKDDEFDKITEVDLPENETTVPNITSAVECRKVCSSNCSCSAYTYDVDLGCLKWNDRVFNLRNISADADNSTDQKSFFLKLAASELYGVNNSSVSDKLKERNRHKLTITFAVTLVAIFILSLSCWYYLRSKKTRKGEDLLSFDLGMTQKFDSRENPHVEMLGSLRTKEVKLPLFSFASVAAATGNFSADNKLGEGGFGPVYKGKLLNGDEVAVKRLSRKSGQGWEELENEALLIAKLQHRNLVRLLGCCIEKDEKILVYEFMPNKSLDFFLFDPIRRTELDWEKRVGIIDGIAQGLLYLHEYSRLRIIHRDLKASNILLDESMNPKISDFGMARIFGGNELGANTRRIVGTYGYMSPEYAVEGHFSVKSDVFSFGVLLLEILTGKKNTEFFRTRSLNLLNHAWWLWKSNKMMDIIDSTLKVSSENMSRRYVHIGFLCVQESSADRPTMSEVVSMLRNDTATLPYPMPPAFTSSKSGEISSQGSRSRSIAGTGSASDIEMTNSAMQAR